MHPDDPQKLVSAASNLLSELTMFAGVVVTPRRPSTFKHVEFMELSAKRVLLIIVTTDHGRGDCFEQLATVPQRRDAKLLQVLSR